MPVPVLLLLAGVPTRLGPPGVAAPTLMKYLLRICCFPRADGAGGWPDPAGLLPTAFDVPGWGGWVPVGPGCILPAGCPTTGCPTEGSGACARAPVTLSMGLRLLAGAAAEACTDVGSRGAPGGPPRPATAGAPSGGAREGARPSGPPPLAASQGGTSVAGNKAAGAQHADLWAAAARTSGWSSYDMSSTSSKGGWGAAGACPCAFSDHRRPAIPHSHS